MVNWQDPVVLQRCFSMLCLSVYASFGMYMLDFVTSLPFDYEIFSGKRRFKLVHIPYLLSRYTILVALVLTLCILNAWEPINCRVYNRTLYAFYHLSFAFASLLVLLRLVVISKSSLKVAVPMGAFYLATVGCLMWGVSQIDGLYQPQLQVCLTLNTVKTRLNIFMTGIFDLTCLIVMIVVLLREPGAKLWKFLLSQGILYFIVNGVAYIPPMVLLVLNYNDAMNILTDTLASVVIAIAAQRMFRALADFNPSDHAAQVFRGPNSETWSNGHIAGSRSRRSQTLQGHGTSGFSGVIAIDKQDVGAFPISPTKRAHEYTV